MKWKKTVELAPNLPSRSFRTPKITKIVRGGLEVLHTFLKALGFVFIYYYSMFGSEILDGVRLAWS